MDYLRVSLSTDQTYNMKDEELKNFICLTSLELGYNSSITDDGVRDLTNLTHLDISFQESITCDGLKNLSNLTSINFEANRNETITLKVFDLLPNLSVAHARHNQDIFRQLRASNKDRKYKVMLSK